MKRFMFLTIAMLSIVGSVSLHGMNWFTSGEKPVEQEQNDNLRDVLNSAKSTEQAKLGQAVQIMHEMAGSNCKLDFDVECRLRTLSNGIRKRIQQGEKVISNGKLFDEYLDQEYLSLLKEPKISMEKWFPSEERKANHAYLELLKQGKIVEFRKEHAKRCEPIRYPVRVWLLRNGHVQEESQCFAEGRN